jgi:hypothetical protein
MLLPLLLVRLWQPPICLCCCTHQTHLLPYTLFHVNMTLDTPPSPPLPWLCLMSPTRSCCMPCNGWTMLPPWPITMCHRWVGLVVWLVGGWVGTVGDTLQHTPPSRPSEIMHQGFSFEHPHTMLFTINMPVSSPCVLLCVAGDAPGLQGDDCH